MVLGAERKRVIDGPAERHRAPARSSAEHPRMSTGALEPRKKQRKTVRY